MFEPFVAAPTSAKVVNGILLFTAFLSWVSSMVAFGDPLHTSTLTIDGLPSFSATFYYNKVSTSGSFGSLPSECSSAGKGWVAMNVFAFLFLLPLFFGTFARLAGLSLPVIGNDLQHQLTLEFIGSCVTEAFFFLAICVWGGGCYGKSSFTVDGYSFSQSSRTGVGFGLEIAVFFFLLINIVLLHLMRSSRPEWQIGQGSNGGHSSGSGSDKSNNYDGPHTGPDTYAYSASDASSA